MQPFIGGISKAKDFNLTWKSCISKITWHKLIAALSCRRRLQFMS